MALFAIGDLHLSLGCNKPMDVFEGWEDYVPRLEKNWRDTITEQDTIVLMGDNSWAMNFEEALADFAFLHSLPGQKIVLKGNHDYWWTTMAKMTAWIEQNQLDSIRFLHNNSYEVEGVSVCGTRSWLFEADKPQDEKVMAREVGRLRASLQAATLPKKLVFLHYPPVYVGATSAAVIETMQEFGVNQCYYGHLHGGSIRWAVQGQVNGIQYKLLSADSLGFKPYKIN
ncbi:metallophosphoesterase [Ruminococcaceae bacterium OttesenSCG-928-A16]|nr:metallophosphoesterase [Ruminococcaceae bacterium OttesenSCG-928-A16]